MYKMANVMSQCGGLAVMLHRYCLIYYTHLVYLLVHAQSLILLFSKYAKIMVVPYSD